MRVNTACRFCATSGRQTSVLSLRLDDERRIFFLDSTHAVEISWSRRGKLYSRAEERIAPALERLVRRRARGADRAHVA